MRLLILVEIVVWVVGLWIVLTQVVAPALRGTALFPFFRKEHKIKEAIIEANQADLERQLEEDLEDRLFADTEAPDEQPDAAAVATTTNQEGKQS